MLGGFRLALSFALLSALLSPSLCLGSHAVTTLIDESKGDSNRAGSRKPKLTSEESAIALAETVLKNRSRTPDDVRKAIAALEPFGTTTSTEAGRARPGAEVNSRIRGLIDALANPDGANEGETQETAKIEKAVEPGDSENGETDPSLALLEAVERAPLAPAPAPVSDEASEAAEAGSWKALTLKWTRDLHWVLAQVRLLVTKGRPGPGEIKTANPTSKPRFESPARLASVIFAELPSSREVASANEPGDESRPSLSSLAGLGVVAGGFAASCIFLLVLLFRVMRRRREAPQGRAA